MPIWNGGQAKRIYDVSGVTCEGCGLKPARVRHHKDQNTHHNERSNIELLCVSCHRRRHPRAWSPEDRAKAAAALRVRAAAVTHCPYGHPYDTANTYHNPNGGRVCRICRARRLREMRAAAWVKTGQAYRPRS